MRFWLIIVLLAAPLMALPIGVDEVLRVTEVKADEMCFGVARTEDNPHRTQRDVYLQATTKTYRENRSREGVLTQVPLTLEVFIHSLKPGDIVRIRGDRNIDLSIQADEIYLQK